MLYKVLHTGVGPFAEGRVVSDEQLKAIPGMNVDRLLNHGALAIADSGAVESPEPLPPGPENPGGLDNKPDSGNAPGGTPEEGGEGDEGGEDAPKYEAMKKADLLAAGTERGIAVDDTMTRAQIIEKLQEADQASGA